MVEFHDIEEVNNAFNGERIKLGETTRNPLMLDFKLL